MRKISSARGGDYVTIPKSVTGIPDVLSVPLDQLAAGAGISEAQDAILGRVFTWQIPNPDFEEGVSDPNVTPRTIQKVPNINELAAKLRVPLPERRGYTITEAFILAFNKFYETNHKKSYFVNNPSASTLMSGSSFQAKIDYEITTRGFGITANTPQLIYNYIIEHEGLGTDFTPPVVVVLEVPDLDDDTEERVLIYKLGEGLPRPLFTLCRSPRRLNELTKPIEVNV